MVVFFGVRPYGTIDRCDRVATVTYFLHAFFVPLLPLRSAIVVHDELGEIAKIHPIGLSFRSIVAAYLRIGAPVAAILLAASWWPAFWIILRWNGPTPVIVVLLALSAFAWTAVGRPSARTLARRRIYARVLGESIDPAELGEERETVRAELRARFDSLPSIDAGYREAQSSWTSMALASNDPQTLAVAATRARVEASSSKGDERKALESAHDALIERLLGANTKSARMD
ncbi:MAG: hypothetical protein ACXVEE_16925 [Polyangiales bacterium]